MTDQEIEALRKHVGSFTRGQLVKQPDGSIRAVMDPDQHPLTRALPRLLEERRRLIEALSEAKEHMLGRALCPDDCITLRLVKTALAFASAPSAELPPEQKPDHGSKP